MDFVDVAIIGAGFSGTMLAIHLLEAEAGPPLTVALIERGGEFGRGVAYGTSCWRHLLNVPAAKMSAFPDQPDHFLEWLQTNRELCRTAGLIDVSGSTFAPRRLYGLYVMSLLASSQKSAGERLRRITAEITDLEPLSDGSLNLRPSGAATSTIRAAKVVLAVGNFPPGDPLLRDRRFHRSKRYLNDPWVKETHDSLAEPGDILILGSGLTALDLLLSLEERKTEGRIHILSRRGLFPLPHRLGLPAWTLSAAFNKENLPRELRPMFRLVREEVKRAEREGADWRAVIDALRPLTQPFWRNLPIPERRRFLRLLRAYWEPHRHRAPQEALAIRDTLIQSGQLLCHRGRIISIAETEQDLEVRIRRAADSSFPLETLRVSYVVNCTGPECNYQKLKDPLIVQLFGRGLIRPDPLLLGLDTDAEGGLINYLGESPRRVFTLGSPRKGTLLETTAVPELRGQARDLAKVLQSELAAYPNPLGLELLPERFYAFDI